MVEQVEVLETELQRNPLLDLRVLNQREVLVERQGPRTSGNVRPRLPSVNDAGCRNCVVSNQR